MRSYSLRCAGLVGLAALSLSPVAQAQQKPEGYKQILPRGGIPAIDNPVYVSAEEAEIPDDAWVMGVIIEGQPRAYSITLLNHHEIVNDKIGDTAFAAVW